MLAALLTDFKDAVMSGYAGTSRPTQLQAGGTWIDTTQQGAPTYWWIYKLFTGTTDVEIFRININSGYGGALTANALFEVRQISADTVGAFQELVKNRFDNNGQVLSGDTVAEIQFIGRTLTSTNPTVAYIKYLATDDQGASSFGGTLSFYSTPEASSIITEHLRFINGLVETPVPLVVNALRLGSQNVATASAIVQLNADYAAVEFTGSTTTEVQGIQSDGKTQEIVLHNRSTASVILKHLNGSAAANDRIELPTDQDYTIEPNNTITLFYSAAGKWKLKTSARIGVSKTKEVITGLWSKWTAPADVPSRITVSIQRMRNRTFGTNGAIIDRDILYQMGSNYTGQLGVGNVVGRSSPVAVLGGLRFAKLHEDPTQTQGDDIIYQMSALTADGTLYAWGMNFKGGLGVGNSVPRSSPVAVLGGLKFRRAYIATFTMLGLTYDGTAYAWGQNSTGELGLGDTTARSSPVAVLGGLKFSKLYLAHGQSELSLDGACTFGLTKDGHLYGWGNNDSGQLAQSDVTPRSSPVAILASVRIKKFGVSLQGEFGLAPTCYALTEDGDLYAWGRNNRGQIGDGTRTNRSSPILILSGTKFKDMWPLPRLGIIALTTGGSYYCWGDGSSAQHGAGDTVARSSPVACVALNAEASTIDYSTIYAFPSGTVWQIGDGSWRGIGYGQELATNTTSIYSSPVAVFGGLKFAKVMAGSGYQDGQGVRWGIMPNGTIYTWGYNFFGGMGVGNSGEGGGTSQYSSTVLVLGPAGINTQFDGDVVDIEVTPSTVYPVKLGEEGCYFGNVPLGTDVEKITIEYTKRGNA